MKNQTIDFDQADPAAAGEISSLAGKCLTPDFGGSISVHYILGMAKIKGAVKSLLDIDQIIAADTIEHITAKLAA